LAVMLVGAVLVIVVMACLRLALDACGGSGPAVMRVAFLGE
jgi:hypothetical protein